MCEKRITSIRFMHESDSWRCSEGLHRNCIFGTELQGWMTFKKIEIYLISEI